MPNCPEYRIRLFLSVDLVGSTAFKAKVGEERRPDEIYPIWLSRTKNFYRDFPQILAAHYFRQKQVVPNGASIADAIPQVWKTVGDEIIFCVRLSCLEHLAICYTSFIRSLSEYGDALSQSQPELDVKGCAWIAIFPAPNITIHSPHRVAPDHAGDDVGNQLDEAQELLADATPGNYDFLGKNIDIGFRVSKYAQSDQLATSLELAWLLSLSKHYQLIDADFYYKGRESLKGVLNNQPYPVVIVDTERAHSRRELHALERTVNQESPVDAVALRRYLHSFMTEHGVDVPLLPRHNVAIAQSEFPDSYNKFKHAWEERKKEDEERGKNIEESAKQDAPDVSGQVIPLDLEEVINRFFEEAKRKYDSKNNNPDSST